jgi:hypothetical protein
MNELRVLNLSTYTSPKIVENKTDNFVAYGDDNNYFQFLIDRYNGSATNNAIINGMSEMIFGKGLDATDSSRKPEAYAKMITLFHDDCVRRLASDLKLMGNCAMQVIYSKDRKSIARVEHIPIETLRAEKCNEKGEIEAYYMHPDWSSYKKSDKPLRIEAFGYGNAPIQIYYIKPYKAGFKYYSPVDYQGGLQYAELEEEISNYHINNVKSGLAPSMLINMNNGVPDPEQRQLIENRIYQKFSGSSNSGKFILSFNDDPATAATIEPIQLSDAHNQYQFLSDESMRKIMVAHRVVSPMLLGVKDSSGLGNNADELKTASILMDNTVIRPFQTLLINAFDDILSYNDISLNLYFKTLQPLEFTELDNVIDSETREEETGVKMSVNESEIKMSSQVDFSNLEEFGEDEDLTDWELIDERKVDYDLEDELDKQINDLNSKKQSLLSKIWNFATTGTARPNANSEQDGTNKEGVQFKVRYQYAPLTINRNDEGTKTQSRDFCKKMVAAKKIYRKEDIEAMSQRAVNAGWGLNGADTYDIWLYKGGGDCHHFWMRKTYMAKGVNIKPSIGNPNAEVSVNQAIKDGFKPEVNAKEVAMRPTDMPNSGFVNKVR